MPGTLSLICCFVLCSYLLSLNSATKIDLESEKRALQSKLSSIFQIQGHQQILVDDLIEKTFAEIEKNIADCPEENDLLITARQSLQTEKPFVAHRTCGPQLECVPKAQCNTPKDNSISSHGQSFEGCADNEICCEFKEPLLNKKERVKGETAIFEFPWMVAILEAQDFIGGGALITWNIILTSAFTVNQKNLGQITVRAGDWNKSSTMEEYPHQDRLVKAMISHEEYQNNKKYNNIALLQLKIPFSEMPHIKPISLPSSLEGVDQTNCIVTAWGSKSSTLHSFPIFPMTNSECEDKIRQQNINWFGEFVRESILCAAHEPDIESCGVDEGSPLVCAFKNFPQQYTLVGLVNCGWQSAQLNNNKMPGVYVNVTHFSQWVRN